MRALPQGAKRERSRLFRREGAFPKAWLWNAQFDYCISARNSLSSIQPNGFGKLGALAKSVIFARAI